MDMSVYSDALEWPEPPPPGTRKLRVLSEQDWQHWQQHGYVMVHDAVPKNNLEAVVETIHAFLEIPRADPDAWYKWEHDIYADKVPIPDRAGRPTSKPPHGARLSWNLYSHVLRLKRFRLPVLDRAAGTGFETSGVDRTDPSI